MPKAPIFPIPFIANAAKQFVCVVVAITFLIGPGIGPIPAYAQELGLSFTCARGDGASKPRV